MKSKETLRKTILSKRKFIDPEDIAHKSRYIFDKLIQLTCLREADSLLAYFARPDEVNTLQLIDWALAAGKSVYTPITRGHGTMEWTQLTDPYTLKNGPLGIPVPESLNITSPPSDAPAIIPCVGFAENGHRIGHGAGYYDRYLAQHQGPNVAVALEVQLVPDFQEEAHDIRMDAIITESALYDISDSVS